MLETLDAAAVRRWCGAGLAALRAHQHEIDELNVYPVPDGDTGTNLVLTLTSAHEAVEAYLTHAGENGAADPDPGDENPGDENPGGGNAPAGASPGGAHPAGAEVSGADGRRGKAKKGRPKTPDSPGAGEAAPSLAAEAIDEADAPGSGTPLGRVMRRMARGALLGARGNSGVIVSQILRGMADTFSTTVSARGADLARALRTASEAAYAAVARPVEGTVLSVAAAAAEGAGRIKSDDLVTVARAAARSAAEALARTPQQLPVLARAGVVDAGGRGLVVLLDALVEALSTTDPQADGPAQSVNPEISTAAVSVPATDFNGYEYEVQYLLDADEAAVEHLKDTLDALGDSLVVVGTGEGAPPTWNVHVHVDDIGAAIEAGVVAGRPHRISVTRLEDRSHGHSAPAEVAAHPAPAGAEPAPGSTPSLSPIAVGPGPADRISDEAPMTADGSVRGAVVVAAGDGLTSLFADEGAVVLGRNPSTAEILAAIEATGARQVVLLPNDANTHAVAMSAAREAVAGGRRVSVVPTRSPVQALAALAVRDPGRHFDEDVIAMAEAAGACRYGEVTTAAREALTVAGRCRPGDLLGLVDGEVHVIGGPGPAQATTHPGKADNKAPENKSADNEAADNEGVGEGEAGAADKNAGPAMEQGGNADMAVEQGGATMAEVSRRLIDRMLGGGGELVTLVLGAGAPPALEGVLRAHIARTWPFVEVQCYAGGQPRYHLLVGVE